MDGPGLKIDATLAGKNILLSGTTGFLGKVVLSMLLARFEKVGRVYALIRPGVSDRARDRFNHSVAPSPALRPIVEQHGEQVAAFLEEKVVPIDGDVTQDGCGISDATIATLRSAGIDVIINSAGLVDFDPPVDEALSINVVGVRNLIALARELQAPLLHVSTCFVAGRRNGQIVEDDPIIDQVPLCDVDAESFAHRHEIARLAGLAAEVHARADDSLQSASFRGEAKTRLHDQGRDPSDAKALATEAARLRKHWITRELRRDGMERAKFWGWTNTYTFTKSLGEQLLASAVEEGLRACIVRPSIVESALEFPFPGWNEGFTTTAPLIMMTRKGLPQFPYAKDLILDVIPVDAVAGVIIAAAAQLMVGAHKLAYHVATGDSNPLTVEHAIELTGLGARRRARAKGERGLGGFWLRHHEMRPLVKDRYKRTSVPLFQKIAQATAEALDRVGPDRLGWARQPAAKLRDWAVDVSSTTRRLQSVIDMFMPFVAENRYVFRGDNTRQLVDRLSAEERALISYKPAGFLWRDYWFDVHLPGLERWVFPKLEEELAKKPRDVYVYRSLTELFEAATHTHRHRVACQYLRRGGDEHLTYGELRKLAFRVGGFLSAQGIQREDRVLLVAENRPEWVAAYFGIILAGATVVPVDAQAKPEEIVRIAAAAGAKGALISPRTGRRLMLEGADPSAIAATGAQLWLLDQAVCWKEPLPRSQEPARLASIIFTSGTTGTPKGVMLTHRNFTFEVSRLVGVFNLGVDDNLLSVLPLHHTFEFSAGLLTPLSRGARMTYLSELTPKALNHALKQGVTGLIGVPALWELLQRKIAGEFEDKGALPRLILEGVQATNAFLRQYFDTNAGPLLAYPIHRALGGRLKHLVSGGAALNPEVADFFRSLGFNLTEGYGLTETAPVLTVADPRKKHVAGSVGRALPGIELRIDRADGEGVGEVLARGPNVMAGYFANEEATRAVLDADGWLHTGDLGRLDAKANLFLVGRQKDLIVDTDGRNVYPDEVEELYAGHAAIKELSVVGLPQGGRERVAALVVPRDADGATRQAITEHLRVVSEGLPFHKRIKVWRTWEGELPRTATRKVRRPDVRTILERLIETRERIDGVVPSEVGSQEALQVVRQLLAAVLGKDVASIDPEARLTADLGLDSLMFVELGAALEARLGVEVASDQLMGIERVRDLAPLLQRHKSLPRAVTPAHSREGSLPVPALMRTLGRKALGFSQQQFYERVMRMKVDGRHHIPVHTGFIVVANHTSHLDAGFVKMALGDYGRNLVTLAAQDYFFGSTLRRTYFENFTNVLPIERHGNVKQSLRRALETLRRGHTLLLFPEGTRSSDGALQSFKSSLGYLALHARVPVLPIYLRGTHAAMPKGSVLWPRQRRIGATIGQPLEVDALERLSAGSPQGEAYRLVTALVEDAVRCLGANGRYDVAALMTEAGERAPKPRLARPADAETIL